MSSIDINFKTSSNSSFIEKVVEQGQRLRNAMVEALLSYDPFNKEILNNPDNYLSMNIKSDPSVPDEKKCFCDVQKENIKQAELKTSSNMQQYSQRNNFCTNEESEALEVLRSMSLNNLLPSTSARLYKGCCDICDEYENRLFYAGRPMSGSVTGSNHLRNKRSDKARTVRAKEKRDLLQYVDSLRVQVYSLRLNSAGVRKTSEGDSTPRPSTKTYCVEYGLPAQLKKPTIKTGARVDSGLQTADRVVRLCSRHERDGSIYFKQRSVHPVRSLSATNLFGARLVFKVGWRQVGQRTWRSVGTAEADLGTLITAHSLSLEQELTVLGEGAPVVLGSLKAVLQFGCDGLYFGEEFVDAMSCSKENANLSESDSIHRMSDSDQNDDTPNTKTDKILKSTNRITPKSVDKVVKSFVDTKRVEKSTETIIPGNEDKGVSTDNTYNDNYMLHTLIHVYETRISTINQSDMYLVSHGLTGDDITISKTMYRSDYTLIFNLRQLIAVQYNEELLDRLRDNYIVIEVRQRDRLLGIAKLSVHNLYLAYRNAAIVKLVLAHNSQATVVVDGWEPITDPVSGQVLGELRALVALGTQQQVDTLELCRNQIQSIQQSVNIPPAPEEYVQEKEPEDEQTNTVVTSDKIDAYTQSDSTPMERTQPAGDFLSCFLEQLIELNQRTAKRVETSTNTEANEIEQNVPAIAETTKSMQPVVRNTADLLDSLHQALTAPEPKQTQSVDSNAYFKAHVVIESALHLPVNSGGRRRCRSRRGKPRSTDDSLPSAYVTFQPRPDVRCEATPVATRTTSPRWDYRRDVHLPADLLLQSHKRLIFRVWRAAGGVGIRPDPRVDTIIGFAALDLTVLLSGLPGVHGWFNIVDFANKCNGQIKIHVTPLETLARFNTSPRSAPSESVRPSTVTPCEETVPAELLSRALKRKFTELDEITQRLKQRLSAVTEADSDDDFADEFERDLNTVCTDPDLPTSSDGSAPSEAALTEETPQNAHCITALDKHLAQGRLKIDSLLEKLSLLGSDGEAGTSVPASSSAPFASRYVSGCSINEADEHVVQTVEGSGDVLKEIGLDSHESIDPDLIFNPLLFQQMFTDSIDSTPRLVQCTTLTGLVNEAEDSRRIPDGAGV